MDQSVISSEIKKQEIHNSKFLYRDTVKSTEDPLEKIVDKLNFNDIKMQFSCQLCGQLNGDPALTACCGETSCESCLKTNVKNDQIFCPFGCGIILKFLPNHREKGLREKLRLLLSDRIIKENDRLLKNSIINSNVSNVQIISQRKNSLNTYTINHNLSTNVSPTSNYSRNNIVSTKAIFSTYNQIFPTNNFNHDLNGNRIVSGNADITISQQNPHFKLFEQARFFIIKSSNRENIITSKLHNEWATTIANQKKLNDAFSQKEVILLFSVNKSGYFQGYSVMTSYISDKVSNQWNNDFSVKLGGTFTIQWLVECEMSFNFVKNLSNPLNNYETVIKSRDTQEIPKEIGIQICHLCYEIDTSSQKNKYDSEKLRVILENNRKIRESMRFL